MLRKVLVFLVLALAALMMFGCATFTPTGITYHHGNPTTDSFWMTIVKNNSHNGTQVAALWRCANVNNAPVCIEAKLLKCTNPDECQTEASQIFQTELGAYYLQTTPGVQK